MSQGLRALVALLDNSESTSTTRMAAHNGLPIPVREDQMCPLTASEGIYVHMYKPHICLIN